jgi:hypothetical protein
VRAALDGERRAAQSVVWPSEGCAGGTRTALLSRGRTATVALLGALCLLLAASLVASASASASETGHREHVLTSSFSAAVNGASKTKPAEPGPIAVNDTTGDVYVVEQAHKLVDQFKPAGGGGMELVRSFETKVGGADAIAVDNSSSPSAGDVYVGSSAGKLFKFTEEGTPIEMKGKTFPKFESIVGLAVDTSGDVFVSEESGTIAHLNSEEKNGLVTTITTGLAPGNARPGLAVDSKDNFYAGSKGVPNEPNLPILFEDIREEVKALDAKAPKPEPPAYQVVAKLEAGTGSQLISYMNLETSPAVAVNDRPGPGGDAAETDDVYVVSVTGAPTEFTTTVSQFSGEESSPGKAGELIQRITLPAGAVGSGIAIDHSTGTLYVVDQESANVDVYTLAPAGEPHVSALSANSSPSNAFAWTLGAKVDPMGSDTHYHFEYGTSSCAESACTSTASTDLGESFGPQAVSQEVTGLSAGSVYHYRVVAESSLGTATSQERTFAIPAGLEGLPDGREWELVSPPNKNGAEPEAITAEGGAIRAAEAGGAITYVSNGPFAGEEPEGNQSPEFTQILSVRGPEGWSSRDMHPAATNAIGAIVGEPPPFRSFSPNLSLAAVEPSPGVEGSGETEAHPPLAPNETHQKTLYLRDDKPLAPEPSAQEAFELASSNGVTNENSGFLAIVNDKNAEKAFGSTVFGGPLKEGLEFRGSTPDLGHVVFSSAKVSKGLWEWSGATKPLRQVSILPKGESEPNAALGLVEGRNPNNAISSDGSRVVFSTKAGHLYVRDFSEPEHPETVQLDTFNGVPEVSEPAPQAAFQTASVDGSKVFFTDPQRLTADSKAVKGAPDLYVFESTPGIHPVKGKLRDLTPRAGTGIVGHNGNGVLGASEDGSYVYFVANGALTPDATPGHCPLSHTFRPPGITCNLYLLHFNGTAWEAPKLVAALSTEDAPDWGNYGEGNLKFQTSRVSPNGQYVAFMSNRNLTGYEPIDANSGKRDEEVYVYSAQSAGLACASCNPSGARPFGVHDLGATDTGESAEGIGLIVDRPQTWAQESLQSVAAHWLAGSVPGWTAIGLHSANYQSRYLSNSGRLFFNSPDHLVTAATGEKEKVYEYQPQGLGSCTNAGGCVALISGGDSLHESAFLDANATGNEVFFLAAQALVPNPEDNFSVYDAHVCETSSPCPAAKPPPPPPCDEETVQCREPGALIGGSGSLATGNTATPGNVNSKIQVLPEKTVVKPPVKKPLTRAQKLAKALKACHKLKQKSKRVACEKAARKKYGSKKKPTKKAVKK